MFLFEMDFMIERVNFDEQSNGDHITDPLILVTIKYNLKLFISIIIKML